MSLGALGVIQLLPDHPTLEICTSFKGLNQDVSLQSKKESRYQLTN